MQVGSEFCLLTKSIILGPQRDLSFSILTIPIEGLIISNLV